MLGVRACKRDGISLDPHSLFLDWVVSSVRAYVRPYVRACMRACVRACVMEVCRYLYVCVQAGGGRWVSCFIAVSCSLETVSSTELGTRLASGKPRDPPSLPPTALRLQANA